jgi:hypothetical protein
MDSADPNLPIIIGAALFLLGLVLGWTFAQGGKHRREPDRKDADLFHAAFDFGALRDKADKIIEIANEISQEARRGQKNTGATLAGSAAAKLRQNSKAPRGASSREGPQKGRADE